MLFYVVDDVEVLIHCESAMCILFGDFVYDNRVALRVRVPPIR